MITNTCLDRRAADNDDPADAHVEQAYRIRGKRTPFWRDDFGQEPDRRCECMHVCVTWNMHVTASMRAATAKFSQKNSWDCHGCACMHACTCYMKNVRSCVSWNMSVPVPWREAKCEPWLCACMSHECARVNREVCMWQTCGINACCKLL
jgi:hypothetical protein